MRNEKKINRPHLLGEGRAICYGKRMPFVLILWSDEHPQKGVLLYYTLQSSVWLHYF